jgi:hypothetical protein
VGLILGYVASLFVCVAVIHVIYSIICRRLKLRYLLPDVISFTSILAVLLVGKFYISWQTHFTLEKEHVEEALLMYPLLWSFVMAGGLFTASVILYRRKKHD